MIFPSGRLRGWVNDKSGKPSSFIVLNRISIPFPIESRCSGSRQGDTLASCRRISAAFSICLLLSGPVFAKVINNRVADYSIDVQLHPRTNAIAGREVLVWHNTTSQSAGSLYFHLDLNAFKDDNTTFMAGREHVLSASARGWINITGLTDLRTNTDLTGQIQYVSPAGSSPLDSTVMMVQLPTPVGPGDSIAVSIDFIEQLPEAISCIGWAPGPGFYLVSGWFPKIGVFQKGKWNCHRVRTFNSSFADFGVYGVNITVPAGYKVGATGEEVGKSTNSNGTVTFHYAADDVHDFGWSASPDFVRATREFNYPGLPQTKVILLLQQLNEFVKIIDCHLKCPLC